jgi:hypothetical protein
MEGLVNRAGGEAGGAFKAQGMPSDRSRAI